MPYGSQTGIAPLIINPITGGISGFATGAGLTFHGGGTITGASGAVNIATVGATALSFSPAGTEKARFAPTTGNLLLGGLTTDAGAGFVLQVYNATTAEMIKVLTGQSDGTGYGLISFFDAAGRKAYIGSASGNNNLSVLAQGAGSSVIISSSNTTALTLNSSQAAIFAGPIVGAVQALSGAGAVNVTQLTTAVTSTGVGNALSLANGVAGQLKTIIHDVDGGTAVLTPTTKTGFSTITFTNAGDAVTLQYFTTRGWMVIGSFGVTIS